MGEHSWAYIDNIGGISSSLGPTGSIQFKTNHQEISGSDTFMYSAASEADYNSAKGTLFLTASKGMITAGPILAHAMGNKKIIDTAVSIPSGYNLLLWGPITITSTVTVHPDTDVKIRDLLIAF